jgi:transposase-like protein
MDKYLEQIKPQVSSVWRADELYLKVKGNMKYLFAMMDDETRFWIAQEVADSKYAHDARHLFSLARAVAGKTPKVLITDGLPSYREAYLKEFYTHKLETRTEHIHSIRIQGDHNNNKMERLNGEIRDREKVMRGLKKPETPIIPGYQIYHNYVRPHEALEGKTPADACGIDIQGENKWITLIQNASHTPKSSVPHPSGRKP